ncbi:MAG: type II toxin-antitoxin system Phd/YefM family antitoxin [Pyrinomonadaceae bacterium]|nr:type II toxin-antitoxin system Phd/YefM family antitoxin [Pyrinomonadaceae bacterium]
MTHTVKDAKNNLSSLIRLAEKGEPQIIRRNDMDVAVVVSIDDWRKLKGKQESLVEILRNSPLIGEEIDLTRQEDLPRDFSFGE